MQKIITSEQNMIDFGTELAKDFSGGDIILLQGDLGTGKTTLTKGIAQGLGINNDILSPTFSIMNVYEVESHTRVASVSSEKSKVKSLIHIDTYRLEDEEQLIEIGVEDYLGIPGVITIIEWPEKIKSLLADKKIITISIDHVDDGRKIEIEK